MEADRQELGTLWCVKLYLEIEAVLNKEDRFGCFHHCTFASNSKWLLFFRPEQKRDLSTLNLKVAVCR